MRLTMNNNRFANRLTAFFVMLAIMLTTVTPIAWADTTGVLNGGITASPSIISVGEQNESQLTYSLGVSGSNTFDARLYITSTDNGDVSEKIRIGVLPSWTEGASFSNLYATYTLHKDESGRYYLAITGFNTGDTLNTYITANFLKGVSDGTKVEFKLCNGSYENEVSSTNGVPAKATLTAKADAQWRSYKSGDVTSITVNSNATTLANNTNNTGKITYKIIESNDSDGTSSLDDGDAVIASYTAYDTVTLPPGTYIAAGSDVNAAIKAAYSIDGVDYKIDNIVKDSKGNVTGFRAYWTVTNQETKAQLPKAEYTAILDLSKVNVNGKVSSSEITNELETEYTWNTAKGSESKKTDTTTAITTVVPDGSAIAGVTKNIKLIKNGNTGGLTKEWELYNAKVTKGDKILYYITVTNGSETEQSYTISDELSKYGLKYIEWENIPTDENDVNNRQYLSGETGTITIQGRSTAYLCVWAEVTEDTDKDKDLTNTVTVKSGSETMDASATVTQKKNSTGTGNIKDNRRSCGRQYI